MKHSLLNKHKSHSRKVRKQVGHRIQDENLSSHKTTVKTGREVVDILLFQSRLPMMRRLLSTPPRSPSHSPAYANVQLPQK